MPGGTVCSVAICRNNSKISKAKGQNLMFFTFPNDPRIRKEWIRRCYRTDKWDANNKRICSVHFKPEDFADEMRARLLNSQAKKLKKDALPSLFLLPDDRKTDRSEMPWQVEKMFVEERIYTGLDESPTSICTKEFESNNLDFTNVSSFKASCRESDILVLNRQFKAIQSENEILKQKIAEQDNSNKILQANFLALEQKIKKEHLEFTEKVKFAFKDFLTSNQIDIALKNKYKARWSKEELFKAFTLCCFSKQAYIYLRETLRYPLPDLLTLQQWFANINLQNGMLDDVLRIMHSVGQTKSKLSKVTVLSFGEVLISSSYEYFTDKILSTHNYMQVIMARGLFDNWKQPIYIGYDQEITKELLESAICCLHEIQYDVIACVSDCGSGNQDLWKAMGISTESAFCEHPLTKKLIYFFANVPHLLELLRNWFIKTGFILPGNVKINKDPVRHLFANTQFEIGSCLKLTHLLLNCEKSSEKSQSQDVKLAAQLFSNTTATALKQYLPGDDKKAANEVGDFFQLVNDWFDIMNSSVLCSSPTKKPYGLNLANQNRILDKMFNTMKETRCTGRNALQVFQKGIIISIKSLKGLFITMKQDYDIKYISTHKLNQDSLETFFSEVRLQDGIHDQPLPLNIIHCIRLILLGNNPDSVQTNHNVAISEETQVEQYLLASALKQAGLINIDIPDAIIQQRYNEEMITESKTS